MPSVSLQYCESRRRDVGDQPSGLGDLNLFAVGLRGHAGSFGPDIAAFLRGFTRLKLNDQRTIGCHRRPSGAEQDDQMDDDAAGCEQGTSLPKQWLVELPLRPRARSEVRRQAARLFVSWLASEAGNTRC